MRKWPNCLLSAAVVLLLINTGCSTGQPAGKATVNEGAALTKGDPVSIVVSRPAGYAEEPWEKLIEKSVKEKYPQISISWVAEDANTTLDKQITAGAVPDIVLVSLDRIQLLKDLKLDFNMEPLIKKFNMDLNRFEPTTLDMVKNTYGKKELIAIPYTLGFSALYYNKDFFDKFGVAYPKDGMTWDDIRELGKKVSIVDNGVQYKGIGFYGQSVHYISPQLSLPYIDAKNGKAILNTDGWKKVFTQAKSLFDIPGSDINAYKSALNPFIKDKTLAMLVANNEIRNMKGLNWDLVSLPTFKELPKTGRTPIGVSAAITSQSKHKDEAFAVISAMVSDEIQEWSARNGRPTSLKSDKARKSFGGDFSELNGKNLQSIYINNPAAFIAETEYDALAKQALNQVFDDVMLGKKDINTGIRDAEEKTNQLIEAEKQKIK